MQKALELSFDLPDVDLSRTSPFSRSGCSINPDRRPAKPYLWQKAVSLEQSAQCCGGCLHWRVGSQ